MEPYIYINGYRAEAELTPWGELAWKLADVPYVLEYLAKDETIILGGDILTSEMVHNYANWFYNVNPCLCVSENAQQSHTVASAYLKHYAEQHGHDYYAILVTKSKK